MCAAFGDFFFVYILSLLFFFSTFVATIANAAYPILFVFSPFFLLERAEKFKKGVKSQFGSCEGIEYIYTLF